MNKLKNILRNENAVNILILLIVSLFVCIPLLSKKINIAHNCTCNHAIILL